MPQMPPEIVDINGEDPQPRKPRNVPPPKQDPVEPAPARNSAGKRTPADRKLHAQISASYQTLAMGLGAIGMQRGELQLTADGPVISGPFMECSESLMHNADAIAEQWLQYADSNPKVKAWLKRITETSVMAGLIGIHLTCAAPFVIPMLPEHMQAAARGGMMMGHRNGNGAG